MLPLVQRILNSSSSLNTARQILTFSQPLNFHTSAILCGEPLKKKRKMDPTILRIREERKRKKLWKSIRKMLKLGKQLKPLDEVEIPEQLFEEKEQRLRLGVAQTPETLENRYALIKTWRYYKRQQFVNDLRTMDSLVYSQQRALDELKNESEELYNKAIEIDAALVPFEAVGPVDTPPIKGYDSPDGEYIDVTKKW